MRIDKKRVLSKDLEANLISHIACYLRVAFHTHLSYGRAIFPDSPYTSSFTRSSRGRRDKEREGTNEPRTTSATPPSTPRSQHVYTSHVTSRHVTSRRRANDDDDDSGGRVRRLRARRISRLCGASERPALYVCAPYRHLSTSIITPAPLTFANFVRLRRPDAPFAYALVHFGRIAFFADEKNEALQMEIDVEDRDAHVGTRVSRERSLE